jgi:hypothetical protein
MHIPLCIVQAEATSALTALTNGTSHSQILRVLDTPSIVDVLVCNVVIVVVVVVL